MISRKFQMKQTTLKEEVDRLKLKIDAEKRLQKAEIPSPKKPRKGILKEFPDDVTDIPDAELGEYMGIYEGQAAWISFCIARREIDYDHAKVLMDYLYNKILTSLPEAKVTEQRATVEANIFYVECKMEHLEIEADLKLLRSSLESFERYSKTISREISSRSSARDNFPYARTSTPREVHHDHNSRR
jgi:hypothetical protein